MAATNHTGKHPTDRVPTDVRADRPPAAAPDLDSTVVRNDVTPDRRTVYPRHCHEWARLTQWLSADDDAFLALDAWR